MADIYFIRHKIARLRMYFHRRLELHLCCIIEINT